jgi:pimeloyl-ACP methyl ester carboxylesterase
MPFKRLPLGRLTAGVTAITLAALAPVAADAAVPAAAAPAATAPAATVSWHSCPRYTAAVLSYTGFQGSQVQNEFRTLWARTQCGTVRVPLNYSEPHGRQISIAITLLKAADQAHRLGSLLVNPGGPGVSGYLMPVQLAMPGSPSASLNQRYDLIGFDPRGVGYSTRVSCPEQNQLSETAPGPTEAEALQAYNAQVAANRACARSDPALLAQLTTANVARDMNQIRIALHLAKVSFFGVSWGTALGAYYRSLFPSTVSRMWLDSVMGPDFRLDQYTNADAAATELDFTRLAAWIAARDRSYGLGATSAQVMSAVLRLENAYNGHPRKFAGLSFPINGSLIADTATQPSPLWPEAAEIFAELRDAKGTALPAAVKEVVEGGPGAVPADAPQSQNPVANQAVVCNEDAGDRGFGASWAAYQQRMRAYPVIAEMFGPSGQTRCAGWPFPVQPWRLRRTGGSLELSGHLYDTVTPYQWTAQMQSAIGGSVYTVDDDMHAGAIMVPACASHIIAYFDTGARQTGRCAGLSVPTGTTPLLGS